ncbi:hypothetical protein, partial [Parafilimonas sp.]|uniref:hypothetical protein n=1 Tax=Parafilimonas sp. TaxID=1969739 RepID=UPI0039E33EDD
RWANETVLILNPLRRVQQKLRHFYREFRSRLFKFKPFGLKLTAMVYHRPEMYERSENLKYTRF